MVRSMCLLAWVKESEVNMNKQNKSTTLFREELATKDPAQEDIQNFLSGLNTEPTVIIIKSDHQRFFAGEKMSFSEADALIGNLEKVTAFEKGYYSIQYRIDFMMDGQPHNYKGERGLGYGDKGTLLESIEKYHTHKKNSEQWKEELLFHEGREAMEADLAQREMLLSEFVPYLKLHNNLAKIEQNATKALIKILRENGNVNTTEVAYNTAILAYVDKCRRLVNQGDYDNLPPRPHLRDYGLDLSVEPQGQETTISKERPSVLGRLEKAKEGASECGTAKSGEKYKHQQHQHESASSIG